MNKIRLEKHWVLLGEKMLGKQKSNVSPESMTRIALLLRREEGGRAPWALRGSACYTWPSALKPGGPFPWGL